MLNEYLKTINTKFKSGISREHSYRADLEILIRSLVKGVEVINEPSNVTDSGNPDYVITKGKIPIGYIEAKDIGKDLNSKQYKEQFDRYKKALDNLIITDYLTFQFFVEGKLEHEVRIGEIDGNKIKPLPQFYDRFITLLTDFCSYIGQTIKSPKKLAVMMAAKAKLLQNIIENALSEDEKTEENTSLHGQYSTFKQILIHDLSLKGFADIYAQTLAYGMFAARLHDTTLDDFSRYEAAELLPKTNPFLKKLFTYIAGPDIDERIKRTVDNLADVFRATNVEQLLKNFGKTTKTEDPIIHFYETFLTEYDPKLRKSRGVWYTPEPVLKFIVRAVDDILKTEFALPQGLADTSKTKIKLIDNPTGKEYEKEVHKVQILDPATGTGTFLAEVVRYIYNSKFKAMQGAWSGYVDEHLIPRLNGFELLMASYSMAHLKLDMLLRETGYQATKSQRFNIYLTNSLEEHHPDTGTLFSSWLSTEANEANHIKRDTPVMVVLGNPPYAVSSSNKGEWIQGLIKDYKKDLNERKINLDDDYIKFIRYGEYFINKNGEGILAYISNNSFIDGITHRQMRKHLLETFDKIYILDLHGNSKKKETAPDGSKDENVFDIMQGVSINIFVKLGN
jgi:type I restriction-modification system DNA methylase subunit